jgi:hypothetical protein
LALNRGAHPSVFDFNARGLGVADGCKSQSAAGHEADANEIEGLGFKSVHKEYLGVE